MQRRLHNAITLVLAMPIVFGAAATGQDLDWSILNVDITDAGANLDIRIVFHLDGANLPEAVPFEAPISILLDGVPIEPDHIAAVTGLGPALPCPSPQGNVCGQVGGPCQVLNYQYKDLEPGMVNGRCLYNFMVNQCQCVTGLPPVFHKLVPKPEIPGVLEFIIDPFDQTPETDETNNSVILLWSPDIGCGSEDDFDGYLLGSGLHGLGGWKGWDNDPAFDAPITDTEARSADQAVDISFDADLVHEFCVGDTGLWSYTAWQYIPADFTSGGGGEDAGSWFILLNTYNDGGPYNWSTQCQFNSNDGLMKIYDGTIGLGGSVPYVTDRWVKIQEIIDLDDDWTRVYYDDELITEYSWTGGILGDGGGALDVAAVDLFANGSTSLYYDDLTLEPILGCGEGRDSDADGDGLTLLEEFLAETDSCVADTDEDGLLDGEDPCPLDPSNLCEVTCEADLDGDGFVGINDFLDLLAAWGTFPGGPPDFDGGGVGINDFLFLLAQWGACE